jgi:hypothetical protein
MFKVFAKDRVLSPTKDSKSNSATAESKAAAAKAKAAKAKAAKPTPTAASRPPSSQFDTTKPFWTLRILSDADKAVIYLKSFFDVFF